MWCGCGWLEPILSSTRRHRTIAGNRQLLLGNDPAKWHTSVPTYARVRYAGVYPGVDLIYYGNQRQLEYDFVVAPGADPKPIRLRFDGAKALKLDSAGSLVIAADNGEVAFHKPVVYQMAGAVTPVRRGACFNCSAITLLDSRWAAMTGQSRW